MKFNFKVNNKVYDVHVRTSFGFGAAGERIYSYLVVDGKRYDLPTGDLNCWAGRKCYGLPTFRGYAFSCLLDKLQRDREKAEHHRIMMMLSSKYGKGRGEVDIELL